MGESALDPEDFPESPRGSQVPDLTEPRCRPPPGVIGGAGAIPVSPRACWWMLLGCDGVMVAAVLALAEQVGARLLVVGLPGPSFFGGMLLFMAWWYTRGPASAYGTRRRASAGASEVRRRDLSLKSTTGRQGDRDGRQ
jgi:hypothetical protein